MQAVGLHFVKLAEHQRIALWTPLRAQRFSGPFPRLCRTCSVKVRQSARLPRVQASGLHHFGNWLPSMDLHHDDRLNRPTGSFTSPGI